ncbi:MAG: 1,4-dihydroxy-2-naphthoate polyprenyltransferase [Actinomycetota bacterium]
MTTVGEWVAGARVRTLPAAVVPVAVGTAAAYASAPDLEIIWWRAAAALVVSLALQIATNYANDYSDGIRGTDDDRAGPMRLVGSGAAEPAAVKRMAFVFFGLAAVAGLTLAIAVGWELLIVGVAAIAAGWFYTGGSNPYGYLGLGELFVFVFFGLVATVGSAYIQPAGWSSLAWSGAVAVGCLATALLVTNNLRDIPTDAASRKNTLAVRLGDGATRLLYAVLMGAPFVLASIMAFDRIGALLALAAMPIAIVATGPVQDRAVGRALIPVLERTGQTQLIYGVLLTIGLWVG